MLTARNEGHARRLRVQVASLAKIPMDLSSGKVRHDIRDEKFGGLFVVPIANDEQLDAGCLALSDQVDGLGHRTTKPYDGSRAGSRSRFAATSASLRARSQART
jgi:hypothetical protein